MTKREKMTIKSDYLYEIMSLGLKHSDLCDSHPEDSEYLRDGLNKIHDRINELNGLLEEDENDYQD